MALPITIPNTFANATTSIPLSQLDNNFSTVVVAINGIGNGAEALANVNITGGTVANVNVTSGNVNITTITATTGNITTVNSTTVDTTNIEVTNIKAKDGTAAVVISDSSGNVNFDSNTLFVDATNNNVGIGTNSPSSKLDIVKAGNSSGGTMMLSGTKSNAATKYGYISAAHYANTTNPQGVGVIGCTATSNANNVSIGGDVGELLAATEIRLYTAANTTTGGGTQRMVIDSAGRVTTPSQPAFFAYVSTVGVVATANSTIPCNTEVYDVGNNYNTGTYAFTAPIAGKYVFYYVVRYNGYAANVYLHPRFNKNGAQVSYTHTIWSSPATNGNDTYVSLSLTIVLDLAANDSVTLHDASEGGVTLGEYQQDQTGFGGYLLG